MTTITPSITTTCQHTQRTTLNGHTSSVAPDFFPVVLYSFCTELETSIIDVLPDLRGRADLGLRQVSEPAIRPLAVCRLLSVAKVPL